MLPDIDDGDPKAVVEAIKKAKELALKEIWNIINMNNNWIPAVCTSAFCWASADTTFDVILESNESELPSKEGK